LAKKFVFPFVVAARKTISFIRKSFADAKEKNKTIHTIRVGRAFAAANATRISTQLDEIGMMAAR